MEWKSRAKQTITNFHGENLRISTCNQFKEGQLALFMWWGAFQFTSEIWHSDTCNSPLKVNGNLNGVFNAVFDISEI